ncbi:hypothetical protein [Sphingomonas rubra]|uniref:Regulatory protein, Fis family n=1 Tax=Sphingomonas rubra TaxID=634430 RepID=A0A1I5PQ65_9SPHN|nr:hypothetical protein [Sphingomonas rubra]SFP36258.1 hypothetical protein SAMN04488241_101162 [Sphingomonas rubra]
MSRPLTRAKMLENAAFLRILARTGNAKGAAEAVGVSHSVFYRRRQAHPDFAQRWDAAMAAGQARMRRARITGRDGGGSARGPGRADEPHRTLGGEPVTVRAAGGRLQVRRAHPNKLTRACEQAFLAALSATANIALSAAAAGASTNAFRTRRATNPAFAREMRLALQAGYERVEAALLESWHPGAREDEAWRSNEAPPMPAMTANQALQLLYLHQKEARLTAMPAWWAQRAGETGDLHDARLRDQYLARLAAEAEDRLLATVMRNDRSAEIRHGRGMDDDAPVLPALDQVTGWSRADPDKVPADGSRALFGGHRVEHLTPEEKALARRGRRMTKRGG